LDRGLTTVYHAGRGTQTCGSKLGIKAGDQSGCGAFDAGQHFRQKLPERNPISVRLRCLAISDCAHTNVTRCFQPILPKVNPGKVLVRLLRRERHKEKGSVREFSRFRVYLVLVVLPVLPSLGWTQNTSPSDAETISLLVQQVKELQQHDRELQERIRLLEANQRAVPVAEPSPPVPAPSASPETQAASPPVPAPPAASPEMHTLRGLQWRGFGELDYKVLNQRAPELGAYGFNPGSAGNFYTGDFDLFLTSRLSDKTSVLSEIDFEESDAQSFKVDLRRLLFKYDANDHLRFSFGRYQTGIGYYNWAFRSASWLQTTADRPLVMEFASNGGLLPTQAVGLSVTGSIPTGNLGLSYIAEYGSSDTVRPDINGDGLQNDENNGNHINVGFFLTPDRIPGLRIGGSIYHDQISDLVSLVSGGGVIGTQGGAGGAPPESARWNQTIVNGHVVYISRGFEFLNEGFLIRHAPIGPGETFNTPAFYSQFSRKLGPIRPFVRYQYMNVSPQNAIYNDVGLRFGPSFGARYDLSEYIAFKAQLDHTARRGLPNLNGLHLQLSGTF